MTNAISPADARLALHDVDHRRRQIVDEIAVPAWYWWGLAVGWVGLGVISDVGSAIAITVATIAFGAIHSAVAHHVLSGRHGSRQLSVRADVVGRHLETVVLLGLVVLVGVTVLVALAADHDGARHPATMASVLVAVAIVCGGPRLVDLARRRVDATPGT